MSIHISTKYIMKQSIWMQEFSFKNNAVMYRMIQFVLYLMRTNQCDMNSGTHLETGSNIALILMKHHRWKKESSHISSCSDHPCQCWHTSSDDHHKDLWVEDPLQETWVVREWLNGLDPQVVQARAFMHKYSIIILYYILYMAVSNVHKIINQYISNTWYKIICSYSYWLWQNPKFSSLCTTRYLLVK